MRKFKLYDCHKTVCASPCVEFVKVFSYMRPPRDLQKIDRITTAAAHLWWRTHDLDEPQEDETIRLAMEAPLATSGFSDDLLPH